MIELTELMKLEAKDWGRANKSDPFAEAIALTHYQNGICQSSPAGKPGNYEITEDKELRTTANGKEFSVPFFKNMKRP